jgi:sugar lactone lactonase YvrE
MPQPRVISRNDVIAVHAGNAVTGEAPFWDAPRGALWWIDIQGQRLLAWYPQSAREEVRNLPLMPGLIASCADGRLLLGLEDGLYPFDPAHGLQERLVAVEADDPRTRLNDGKPDPAGRLWFGTMERLGSGEPIGRLYRLDTDGRLDVIRQNIRVPNAIAFAPDGRTFYFADSRERAVQAFAYDAAKGEIGSARIFVHYDETEIPDGTCVDAEGALWIAVIGGSRIERRLADGTLDTIVELPVSRPTMPMLGGADGRTLFVTSQRRFLSREQLAREPLAGGLLAIRVEVPAAPVFAVALGG